MSESVTVTVTETTRRETLAAVSNRERVLRAVGDGPVSKAALTDRVDASRSTVDRGIRTLEEHGLVERTDGGYRQTTLGRLLLAEFDRYTERAGSVLEARPVLMALPPGTDLPAAVLTGADVLDPRPTDPYGPVEEGMSTIAAADCVRSVVSTPLTRYAALFEDGLLPASGAAELCLPERALESLLQDRPDWFERAVDSPEVTLLEVPEDPPYTVLMMENEGRQSVVVAVFDDRGVGSGLINDRPAAIEWAEAVFELWRARGTTVSAAER